METVKLGKTGMNVSKIGLGGIPIQRVSEEDAISVVKRCLSLGVNFMDTANGYGTSEERIGKAITGNRKAIAIATKSAVRSNEQIWENLKLSIERLGVDCIDLFQLHNVADQKALDSLADPDGPMNVLNKAKKDGLIKHIGVSSHSMDIAKELVASGQFETIMFPFNFIAREAAEELIPLAKEHDVGFIAMKPLAGGMLDNIEIAFKYLFQFPDIVAIPGIETVEEIEQIVQIASGPVEMTQAEKREMERLRAELDTQFCRRCGYCQPCKEDIQISMVMTIPTFTKRMPMERVFTGRLATQMEKALNCSQCAECEEKCPYHLPIVEMVEKNTKWFYEEKKRFEEKMA